MVETSTPVYMIGVREYTEGQFPVERTRSASGRLVVRAYNECTNNHTDVDVWDLLDWFRFGPKTDVEATYGPELTSDGDGTRRN